LIVLENSTSMGVNEQIEIKFMRIPFLNMLSYFFENPEAIKKNIRDLVNDPSNPINLEQFATPYESRKAWESLKKHIKQYNPNKYYSSNFNRENLKPTLHILGEYDYLCKKNNLYNKNIEIVILPAGHFPHEEVPKEYNEAVIKYLMPIIGKNTVKK